MEAFSLPGIAGGLQAGVSHLWTGLWGHTGLSVGKGPGVTLHLAVGITIFGFEWHRRLDEGDDAFLLMVRLPIGIYAFAS